MQAAFGSSSRPKVWFVLARVLHAACMHEFCYGTMEESESYQMLNLSVQTAPIGYTSIDRLAVELAYAVSVPRDNSSGRFVRCGFAKSARSMRALKQAMLHAYPRGCGNLCFERGVVQV